MLPIYLIIGIFIITGIGFAMAPLVISEIVCPRRPKKHLSTYECGAQPVGENRLQFRISYYLFALVFIIFEIEAIYFIPWAVIYQKTGFNALLGMIIFLGILVVGLIYAIQKQALKWS